MHHDKHFFRLSRKGNQKMKAHLTFECRCGASRLVSRGALYHRLLTASKSPVKNWSGGKRYVHNTFVAVC